MPEVIYTSQSEVYLHLPGVIVAQKATEVRYLLSDGLGSIRQAVDETATVVAYHEFDPYGNPVAGEGDPYGYTGEWWENSVGLLHLRARWYAPETGTFLSVDPVESEPPYQYVRGNPASLVDPSGTHPFCIPLVIVDGPLPVGDGVCVVLIGATLWTGYIATAGPVDVPDIDIPDISLPSPDTPTYPPGPKPVHAPGPPPSPFVSADGTKPISAVPGRSPGGSPEPKPAPTAMIDPFPPTCTPTPDNVGHRVLTIGDGNFSYSKSLYALHRDWKITGTSYGNGSNNQTRFPGSVGNLKLYTNVDARQLHNGSITGRNQYDAIIFNNPHDGGGPQTASLIREFRSSARKILSPGGKIHINVTQKLLTEHTEAALALGVRDNRPSQVKKLPTFGPTRYGPGTIYYAPYIPHYTTGGAMKHYRGDPNKAAGLKNFVFP